MKRDFEPFSMQVDRRVIPNGGWQRAVGALLDVFGIFTAMASTPLNGAGAVASMCLALGSSLLFWGLMLKYFAVLEEKLALLIVGLDLSSKDVDA
jgi:hypothetical protein